MKIQRSFKDNSGAGTLYLVPTPIGNLQDMTFRAVEVLKGVDLIAAEDTRNTGLLLKHFDIATKQTSFHEHNASQKIPDLLERLRSGQSIAQVSDAGMPSISDPGHDLVVAAVSEGLPVVALPGPSAGLTALIASGLAPQPHAFYGFLPRKSGQQQAFLAAKKHYPETQIFYESPHRLVATLENILAVYGDRQVVVVRELTKLYEEYLRGSVTEVLDHLTQTPAKGECLLMVAGYEESQLDAEELTDQAIKDLVAQAIAQGKKPNAAIKEVAKSHNLNRQEVYGIVHGLS